MKKNVKEFTQPHLDRVARMMLDMDWRKPELYGDWLAQTYYHICHSTRLLAAAGSRFTVDRDKFHIQCMSHAIEEGSHEKLSVSDLKELGFRLEDFSELHSTKCLYRNNYYLVDRVSPIALFGYAYFLENIGTIAGTPMEERARSAFGKKATKHLSLHTKEDPGHIHAYEQMLDELPEADLPVLWESIVTTATDYERMCGDIFQRSQLGRKKKAA